MKFIRSLASLAIVPALGAALLGAGGCGERDYPVDPEGGAKQKQARINAYGASGAPSGKPTGKASSGPNLGSQGAARQKAQAGR